MLVNHKFKNNKNANIITVTKFIPEFAGELGTVDIYEADSIDEVTDNPLKNTDDNT